MKMKRLLLALSIAALTAAAALSPSTVHDDIPGTATIGEVSTAAGARNVQDLKVYAPKAGNVWTVAEIDADPGWTAELVDYPDDDPGWWIQLYKNGNFNSSHPIGALPETIDRYEATNFGDEFRRVVFTRPVALEPTGDTLVTSGEIGEVTGYARAVYNFLQGNTNAWFSGTNYPDRTGSSYKHKFALEDGMDLYTMPCSMALMERWEGKTLTVWDQRDWVSWYWNFKSAQFQARINETNAVIFGAIANLSSNMPLKAWSSYTARGLENPDPNTTYIDTKNVTLSAGFAWEKVATVSGAAYWTIVGDAHLSGNESTGVFELKDFDGKSVIKITKGGTKLVYVERAAMLAQGRDAQGRITFDMLSDVQPLAECSTVPDTSTFVAETDAGCPAETAWTDLGGGKWRFHFILKDGIDAKSCLARFKVEVREESRIEYGAAPVVTEGFMYNGVKIAPVIPEGANVGDTITFKIIGK